MDTKNVTGGGGGGIKVTYIETQFVTSDEAGFKDLVQRLTGRSAPLPPAAPHRPLPRRPADGFPRGTTVAGAAVPQSCYYTAAEEVRRPAVVSSSSGSRTQREGMGLLPDMDFGDFSDLFDVGASERSDACYGGFHY